jgi:signal transduction histidine kinase
MQFRVPWPDGRVRWLSAKGRVVTDPAGKPIGLLGIAIDVTERKELEQRLVQSQRMEALGQLAGDIAHDFNNVLMAIIGFSEFALHGLPPDDMRAKDLTEIKNASQSGQMLARQLLAFSRKQPLNPTRLDLNGVITSAQGILQQLLGRQVKLETLLSATLPGVWADAGQIQQVLVNLAVNARDAMPDGGRFLIETFAADRRDEPALTDPDISTGTQIVVRVTDTGTGMLPEVSARVFEPLFTTKAPDKGTGLGLSTVYGIVRQSGGAIDVMSVVGEGTTFRIYFPSITETVVAERQTDAGGNP